MEEVNKQKFSDYLSLNNIICNVEAADEEAVLCKLLEALNRHYPKLDIQNAGAEIRIRESIFSTVIAPGLAVPHARIAGLPFPLVAVACTPKGVAVNNCADKVVMTVLVLTPQDEPNLHLQVLAALCSVFADHGRLETLANIADAESFFAALSNAEGEGDMPSYLKAADVMSMKMLLSDVYHVPVVMSLIVIMGILVVTVLVSYIFRDRPVAEES